jgi:hypothetical protein
MVGPTSSGLFVDPSQMQPIRLGIGTLQWLVNSKQLEVSTTSPIHPLLQLGCSPKDLNNRELVALGMSLDPEGSIRPSAKGKAYAEALRVAAQPEALLEFSEVSHQGHDSMRIVLADGKGTIADIDDAGLSFSPPVAFADLLRGFTRHLQNAELELEARSLWPSQLRLIAWVFSGEEKTLPRALAAERLSAAATIDATEASEVVQELIDSNLFELSGDSVSPSASIAPLLERMASGHLAELLLTPYDEDGNEAEKSELRFVGRPNDRLTTLTLRGELLKVVAGDSPAEDTAINVMAADRAKLDALLRSFIGADEE